MENTQIKFGNNFGLLTNLYYLCPWLWVTNKNIWCKVWMNTSVKASHRNVSIVKLGRSLSVFNKLTGFRLLSTCLIRPNGTSKVTSVLMRRSNWLTHTTNLHPDIRLSGMTVRKRQTKWLHVSQNWLRRKPSRLLLRNWFRYTVACLMVSISWRGAYATTTLTETTEYLERFFRSMLLGEEHDLRNRIMHVDWDKADGNSLSQSANHEVKSVKVGEELPPKCKNCTLEEIAVLRVVQKKPSATQKEIATEIGKSERTVKSTTIALQEKSILQRMNGKRNGYWEIVE